MANLHLIDLSNNKLELDKIFDSVINKIPDLCMPQTYRLANEDDFFGRAKSLEHQPFRKQQYFDKYISLESQIANHSEQSAPITSRANSLNTTPKQPEIKVELENMKRNWPKQVRNKFELEKLRKRQLKELLKKRYSNLSIRSKTTTNQCKGDNRLGYDKLFISMPQPNYPFANPMPGCMMTSNNIDNLREIIVATTEVEWKMLTPVRPDNEYEEKYFDKLINLHRCRHKARLECGYYESNRIVPFKHVRHRYLKNSKLPSSTPTRAQAQLSIAANISAETIQEEKNRLEDKQRDLLLEVEIPKLTLSNPEDERIEELIMDSTVVKLQHQRSSKNCAGANIVLERSRQPQKIRASDDERVEDRVEAIVSQLMVISLDD